MQIGSLNTAEPYDPLAGSTNRNIGAQQPGGAAAFASMYSELLGMSEALNPDVDESAGCSDINLLTGEAGSNPPSTDAFLQFPSSMARYMAGNGAARFGPSSDSQIQGLTGLIPSFRSGNNPLGMAGAEGVSTAPFASLQGASKNQLAVWMDAHALTRSSHHCAMYCRLGMEAAGIDTADRPPSGDAGDYGPFLMRHGAQVVSLDSYKPQVGDTAVFDKTEQHPSGHIEIFDGRQWVSDFMQHGFSPYRDASSTPPFKIYRLG